ncbi:MAG TPA: hypothetical protein VK050_08925 [Flavobacteriaceae bacterium]|nr:hypothetical protein [Flavobacteriaceae bacterium]
MQKIYKDMYTEFTDLPGDARIWIYQSDRRFTDEEVEEISEKTKSFVSQWAAHGSPLKAGFEIRYNRFIVFGVDQSEVPVSGCSIDSSVAFIQDLEKEYELNLLDKMNVTFYTGEFIAHKPLADFRQMAKDNAVSANTIVFNNLVNTKEEYEKYWEVPASESWHSNFM